MVPQGKGGSKNPLPNNVVEWVESWSEIDAWLKENKDHPEAEEQFGEFADRRRALRQKIMNYLEDHPGKVDDVVAAGFGWKGLDQNEDRAGVQHGAGNDEGGGQNKGDNVLSKNYDGDENGNKPNTSVGNHAAGIPGVKGKDYDIVVGPNGRRYAVYKIDIGGNKMQVAIRLPGDADRQRGLGVGGPAKRITKEQFKGLEVLGAWDEFDFNVGEKNPFKGLIRMIQRSYAGTEVLGNDEVLGVLLSAYAGGWSDAELQGQLRQTKWYESTTRWQRDWELNWSDKEKQKQVGSVQQQVVNHLEDTYGQNWAKFVEGGMGKVREWAEKIASGQLGEPGDGFRMWAERQFDQAKKIEGTVAFTQQQNELIEQEQADPEFQKENMFEQVRAAAIQSLGYGGKPDAATLDRWASDLVYARKTQADFDQYLRALKQQMHPYLDPDVDFLDFASAYKGRAEDLLGRPLEWDDKLLQSFAKTNAKGELVEGTAMSFDDFERKLRETDRYWNSKDAQDKGFQLLNFLTNTFTGAA